MKSATVMAAHCLRNSLIPVTTAQLISAVLTFGRARQGGAHPAALAAARACQSLQLCWRLPGRALELSCSLQLFCRLPGRALAPGCGPQSQTTPLVKLGRSWRLLWAGWRPPPATARPAGCQCRLLAAAAQQVAALGS